MSLDDILVFYKGRAEDIQYVHVMLQHLLENTLFIKAEKCEFHSPSVSFLGYIITLWTIQMDPVKVLLVMDWPSHSSQKQMQHILVFINFHWRFINDYSVVAAPLTTLTSVKVLNVEFCYLFSCNILLFQPKKNCIVFLLTHLSRNSCIIVVFQFSCVITVQLF